MADSQLMWQIANILWHSCNIPVYTAKLEMLLDVSAIIKLMTFVNIGNKY